MRTMRSVLLVAVFLGIIFSSCKKDEPTGPGGTGGPATINGRVLSQQLVPLPNVPVVVPGRTPVNSDASGRFSIPDVTPPYTIVAVNIAERQVYVFEGVTRTDPTLTYLGSGVDTLRAASFSGTVHGGTYPQPGDHMTLLGVDSPQPARLLVGGLDSAFSVTVGWVGPTSVTGTVHALQWQMQTTGLPSTYKGYGTIPNVTFTNGGSVSGAILNLSAPGDTSASGTVIIPSGYTQVSQTLGLRVGQKIDFVLAFNESPTPGFNFIVPRTVGTPYLQVAYSASGSSSLYYKTLSRGAGNAVTIPQGTQLILPPDHATNVDTSTVFSWTPLSGAVYRVHFMSPSPASPSYIILTGGTSVSIPNLASFGLGLPSSVSYNWGVYAFESVGGVDGGTGPEGYLQVVGPSGDGGYSSAFGRSFSTRP